jgi:phosphatidylserine decarboxylase
MRIDRAGTPFIAAALVPAAVLALLKRPGLAAPFAAVAGFMAFFFRDPDRVSPQGDDLVLSPADGRVMHAGPAHPEETPPGDWLQVTIFLSPMDVHINRAPISGRVTELSYRPGLFLPAYKPDSRLNERTEIWIDHGGTPVVMRQVVGMLARRIVCRLSVGEQIAAGQRFGLMKFGSRMDVFVPPGTTLLVRRDEPVRAAETVLARLMPATAAASPEAAMAGARLGEGA